MTACAKRYYLILINRLIITYLVLIPFAFTSPLTNISTMKSLECIDIDVTVIINYEPLNGIYPICLYDNDVFSTPQILDSMGINIELLPPEISGSSKVLLRHIQGFQVDYQPLKLQLILNVSPNLLRTRTYTLVPNTSTPPSSPGLPGALLNYSVYANQTAGARNVSFWNDIRLMMEKDDSISNSLQTRWNDTDNQTIRLDTRYQKDYPESAVTLNIGDDTTGGGNGFQDLRFGGIHISRNFSLQPYKQVAPDVGLVGSAIVPSTVDVYVNNILRANQSVTPGSFEIFGVPMLQGKNKIRMIMTDINGRQTEQNLSRYSEPSLLKPNLFAYSLSSGFVRQNWGVESWDYEKSPIASSDLAYGISDTLTAQVHGEIGNNVQLVGIGGIWVPDGQFGVINTTLAQSWAREQNGRQYQLGYQWAQDIVSFSGYYQYSDKSYQDIASQVNFPPLRESTQVVLGMNTTVGDFNIGRITQTDPSSIIRHYDNVNWSSPNDNWGILRIGGRRETGVRQEYSMWISYSLTINRENTFNLMLTPTKYGNNIMTSLNRRTTQQNDFNGQLQYTKTNQKTQSVQGSIDYRTRYGDISFGGYQGLTSDRNSGGYIGAQGSIAILRDGIFLAPKMGDAFGLISTQGIGGIPVKLENNLVGETDAQGYLFLSTLNPNQRNKISLDTRAIPTEYMIGQQVIEVVPSRQHGVITHFFVSKNKAIELRLYNSKGKTLQVGSLVYDRPSGGTLLTQIGHDGILYLPNPESGMTLWIYGEQTVDCKITLNDELIHQAQYASLPIICQSQMVNRND